jgi:hypothetical protein
MLMTDTYISIAKNNYVVIERETRGFAHLGSVILRSEHLDELVKKLKEEGRTILIDMDCAARHPQHNDADKYK